MKFKIKDQYWLRSGFTNVLQNFTGVFFGFGSFFILVRLLSRHDFGAWTLFMSTTTIMETIRGGLIQNALIRYVSSSAKEEHSKIISASFTISGVLTFFCILINCILAHFLASMWSAPELEPMLYWYNLVFLLSGILTQFNCIEQANLQFKGIFVSTTARQAVFFAYILAAFFFSHKTSVISLVYVQILAAFTGTITALYFVKGYLLVSFKISSGWIRKLLNYGKFAFGTSLSSILSGTIDQMMLGAILSPVASGAFNIAVRITNLIDIPTNALATIVFPQSAKRMETEGHDAIKYLYEKSVGTLLAILLPGLIFLFLFSNFVIHLIAGSKYADTVPLLHITLLYCLLIPYGRQFGTIIDSIGKPRITFLIVLITASINLLLNYFFIRHFGVLGAAYATLCSNIAGFILAQRILRKEFKVSIPNTFIYAFHFYPEFWNKYLSPKKQLQ